ncbi:MAG: dihydroxy-acid dehydratase [Acidobacteria bacterium]|nr:dihydroxy-acid dehydratase [Acidobacteriota bacterium]
MREILRLLHGDVLTVTGKTMAENVSKAECCRPEVIRTQAEPLNKEGGAVILYGDLAPELGIGVRWRRVELCIPAEELERRLESLPARAAPLMIEATALVPRACHAGHPHAVGEPDQVGSFALPGSLPPRS